MQSDLARISTSKRKSCYFFNYSGDCHFSQHLLNSVKQSDSFIGLKKPTLS